MKFNKCGYRMLINTLLHKSEILKNMKQVLWLCFFIFMMTTQAYSVSRIKDIAAFEGIRENLLVGYGLVVGLKGTGDSLNNIPFTKQSLESMLERLGVNTRDLNMQTKNVAAVMVTATLPPFSRQGSRIDITVSAMGDAKSLLGGTLLVTPLLGADGEVYAVAQGTLAVNAFEAEGDAESIVQNIPTTGKVSNGAIVEREIGFDLANLTSIRIALRNPDLTTAKRISEAINRHVGEKASHPLDPTTVALNLPNSYKKGIVSLLTEVEQLAIQPDNIAKVVIDETSGVIVIDQNVRISTVAIAQGNLTIRITETPQVSQPNPFSSTGVTVTVPRTDIEVDDQGDRQLGVLDEGVTLQQLVNGLNALGVSPRDLISILQNIKAAGALQAKIEVR